MKTFQTYMTGLWILNKFRIHYSEDKINPLLFVSKFKR